MVFLQSDTFPYAFCTRSSLGKSVPSTSTDNTTLFDVMILSYFANSSEMEAEARATASCGIKVIRNNVARFSSL